MSRKVSRGGNPPRHRRPGAGATEILAAVSAPVIPAVPLSVPDPDAEPTVESLTLEFVDKVYDELGRKTPVPEDVDRLAFEFRRLKRGIGVSGKTVDRAITAAKREIRPGEALSA